MKTVFWRVGETAKQLQTFSASFLCNLRVNPLQFDELYAGRRTAIDGY